MFHRVKSETQPSYQNQQPRNEASQQAQPSLKAAPANQGSYGYADSSAAPYAARSEASTQMTSRTQTYQATTPSSQTFSPEKENSAMNTPYQSASSDSENAAQDQASTRSLDMPGNAYQRTPAARSYASNYPGVYAPSASASAATMAGSDRRLTIGRGITLSGEIESCDYLMVEGTVEAALKGANILEIAESGVFYGTVEINEATIAGRFEGDITVSGRLTVRAGATITGTISYKELEVEAGATIDGRITPVGGAGEAKKPQAASSRKQMPAPARAKSGGQQQANYPLTGGPNKDQQQMQQTSDGELFNSGEAAA